MADGALQGRHSGRLWESDHSLTVESHRKWNLSVIAHATEKSSGRNSLGELEINGMEAKDGRKESIRWP